MFDISKHRIFFVYNQFKGCMEGDSRKYRPMA